MCITILTRPPLWSRRLRAPWEAVAMNQIMPPPIAMPFRRRVAIASKTTVGVETSTTGRVLRSSNCTYTDSEEDAVDTRNRQLPTQYRNLPVAF